MARNVLWTSCLLFSTLAAEPIVDPQMLELIASTEPAGWDATLEVLESHSPNFCNTLNTWTAAILEGGEAPLIHLLQRALRNYNEFSDQKTKPFTTWYKHYQSPQFQIPQIELTLDVQVSSVLVTSRLEIHRSSQDTILVLDGKKQRVHSVAINGSLWPKELTRVTPNELILFEVPREDSFEVVIQSEIDPFHNSSLEGLYASGDYLMSQCEPEGARQIFFTLDRPDVLSRITTRIVADAHRFPYRLSNGNCIEESQLPDGRMQIVWEDPIPKPSYLFACILGNFAKVEERYRTRSGREVSLEAYVPLSKENQAHYSLAALKKAMQFDEQFFDREYDLNSLKMVAAPDFNMGAMENKGLLVFNELYLLADQNSATDANFRSIADVVAHEYFHNWSGNRVTVRNWFELALKEAFTDFRTMLFSEWLFGNALIRPQEVLRLREGQFPQEASETGHPIVVESYVNASSIYDATTYVKGREVFRTLQTWLDWQIPEGFRKTQNLYFERYDGCAVTFRELLAAAGEILGDAKQIAQFECWFTQQGTPRIRAEMNYHSEEKLLELILTQSCPHPRTGKEQEPFLIPFSYEFFRKDGSLALSKQTIVLSEPCHRIQIPAEEPLVPLFLHNFCAPVILDYPYTFEELTCLIKGASDPFGQWEAHQNWVLLALQEMHLGRQIDLQDIGQALQQKDLPLLLKARLLQTPSLRAMAEQMNCYEFRKLDATRELYRKQLAIACKPLLEEFLQLYPQPESYEPTSDQMAIRQLRRASLELLTLVDTTYLQQVMQERNASDNFDTFLAMCKILADQGHFEALDELYQRSKDDKLLFTHWLSLQANSSHCTVADLKRLMQTQGFEIKNPNHVLSLLRSFMRNLPCYHDAAGEGYAFLVDQILEISAYNTTLSHTHLAQSAFIDFENLSPEQQALMRHEMKRLLDPAVPPETRDLIARMLVGTPSPNPS